MPNFNIPSSYTKLEKENGPNKETFVVEPLERGYGITLGNSLRRILLSSVPGVAITSLRIDGVLHEFSTIPGVREDVTEIVLNLKSVRFKLVDPKPDKILVDLKGPGDFKAFDIGKDNPQFEILNPDTHICSLNDDADAKMELRIGKGRGYVPAHQNKPPDYPIGTIFIDSIFSPVVSASFEVIQLQGGEDEDLEKLQLTIETDGSITPEEALSYAANLVVQHMQAFIIEETTQQIHEPDSEVDEEVLRIRNELKRSIDELELSVRSYNCLQAANIKSISDLVSKDVHEMLRFKNFGRKSLSELTEKLSELGLHFGMDIDQYLREDV